MGLTLEKKGKNLEYLKEKGKQYDAEFIDLNLEYLGLMKDVKNEIDDITALDIGVGLDSDEEKEALRIKDALKILIKVDGDTINP